MTGRPVSAGLTYPELELRRIARNILMFTHHGTYIIEFSAASRHMAMALERSTTTDTHDRNKLYN